MVSKQTPFQFKRKNRAKPNKFWLAALIAGSLLLGSGGVLLINPPGAVPLPSIPGWVYIALMLGPGVVLTAMGYHKLRELLSASDGPSTERPAFDMFYNKELTKKQGPAVVAIGGGTGLPSVLRGMKRYTDNLTAIVTVADNGGSSGRLRRDLGILPPGDLRNNIAALANDEDLMTQLFQYRFSAGDLDGHSFGNLFLTALSDITGSMERALQETERVLAVQGSVLPATLDDITLIGEIRHPESSGLRAITGEAEITDAPGSIERVSLTPPTARAYPRSVQAILSADLIVIGPGSLYTSILPTLLIKGITEAIRASNALCVYVCNVATQPGETDGFDVTDHILALEDHVGYNLFQIVLANNHFPTEKAGPGGQYVMPVPEGHEVTERYRIVYADLTDLQYPWRHDPGKLARALQDSYANYQANLVQHEVA